MGAFLRGADKAPIWFHRALFLVSSIDREGIKCYNENNFDTSLGVLL